MKFDKKAVQGELDLAAQELENAGYGDLAEKVDYYSDRLVNAHAKEIPLISRALRRIQLEAKRRLAKDGEDTPQDDKANKAQAAVTKARRSSESRKEVLRRRLKSIHANRKRALDRLATLKKARKARLAKNSK